MAKPSSKPVTHAKPHYVVNVEPSLVSSSSRRRVEVRSVITAAAIVFIWLLLVSLVAVPIAFGVPFNGRVVTSLSQLTVEEWLFIGMVIVFGMAAARNGYRVLKEAPVRLRQIEAGHFREWMIEFPAGAGDGPWIVSGFGEGVPGRRVGVTLLRGTSTLGRQRSFRLSPEAPTPLANISADGLEMATSKSDGEGSWSGCGASYVQSEPCAIRVSTLLPHSQNARPDGAWRLRIELIGDPDPPNTLQVSMSSQLRSEL